MIQMEMIPIQIKYWSKLSFLFFFLLTGFPLFQSIITNPQFLSQKTDIVKNIVGHIIAKPAADKPKHFISVFWFAFSSQLRYCGVTFNSWDSLVLKDEPENDKFAAYYIKRREVVMMDMMMIDPIMPKYAELMGRGLMLSKSELEKGISPLELDLVD